MGKTGDYEEPPPENRPLAGLAKLRGSLPPGPAPESVDSGALESGAVETGKPAGADSQASGGKLVVQRERKGRGGKTVTRVSGLDDRPEDARVELGRKLARALGCGVAHEGGDLLAQGDQVRRAATWLREHIGGRVIEGN